MNTRRLATGAGVAAAIAGLVLVAVPDLAARFGVTRVFVVAFGFAAILLAVADARTLLTTTVDQATTPDVEGGVDHPRPGEEVDDLLAAAARGYDRYTQGQRDRVEGRIREVAIDVLTRQEDCTVEAAETMLVEGSWTDDPYAAAFLGAHEVEDLPLRERIRNAFRPEAMFARRATHAIEALDEREGDPFAGPDRDDDERAAADGPDPEAADGQEAVA